jgi:hypothetical protein
LGPPLLFAVRLWASACRIHIDEVPPDIVLSAGMTATVEIEDGAPPK